MDVHKTSKQPVGTLRVRVEDSFVNHLQNSAKDCGAKKVKVEKPSEGFDEHDPFSDMVIFTDDVRKLIKCLEKHGTHVI